MECELCGQYEVLAKVLVDALEDAERALAHCYDCFDSIIAALAIRDVLQQEKGGAGDELVTDMGKIVRALQV